MTREEYERRARRRRKKRIKRLQRRLVFLCLFIVVGVIGISVLTKAITANTKSDAKASSSKTTASEKTTTKEVSGKITADNQDAADDKAADDNTEPVTDTRSDFAVAPGVAVGSDSQTEEKVVYLTFDDGPSVNTQAVLDILDRYQAKATFFVTGINPDYANMIKVAYDKGNTIGLHTMTHHYEILYASTDAYFSDLDQIGQVVKQQIGYVPAFIRFPGGSSNTVSANYTSGIMSALAPEVLNRGYQYYDWNASCGDGSNDVTVESLIATAIGCQDNNIVLLLHDATGKEKTVQALPQIIEHYQGLGYTFKALDRASYDAHHGINN